MQRKFVTRKQTFTPQASGFGQPIVSQPRFSGQPLQASNHRIAALLPDPSTPPTRNQNFNRNTKKNYINSSNISQTPSYALPRHKVTSSNNNDTRLSHKFDIIRKPILTRRPKVVKNDNESGIGEPMAIQQEMPPNMVLSISNYPPSCNEAALIMFFAKMDGFLQLFSHRTKKHISFVIYNTVDQAKDALTAYHGYQMDHEHKLQVSYSNHEMAYCD